MPPIRPISIGYPGAEDLQRLFAAYPYRQYQHSVQRLDRRRLSRYLADNHRSLFEMKGARHFGVRGAGGRLSALASLVPLPWHSKIYGLKMGKIASFLTYEVPGAAGPLLGRLIRTARRDRYRHLSVRLDGRDQVNLAAFAREGFYIVDCSVKMSLELPCELPPRPGARRGLKVVEFEERYLPAMSEIAAVSHELNRFYNDPALPAERSRELFRRWVERCCRAQDSIVFVALHDESVAGFCIILENHRFNESLGRRVGILDFICLDAAVKGQGLGWLLLHDILHRMRERFDLIELRTNFTNYPALNLYSRAGFKIVASDVYLHWTPSESDGPACI
ncbi:MAG: hypothetical protein Kow0059_14870 [Candidatus Sumerlaeia bacterium]